MIDFMQKAKQILGFPKHCRTMDDFCSQFKSYHQYVQNSMEEELRNPIHGLDIELLNDIMVVMACLELDDKDRPTTTKIHELRKETIGNYNDSMILTDGKRECNVLFSRTLSSMFEQLFRSKKEATIMYLDGSFFHTTRCLDDHGFEYASKYIPNPNPEMQLLPGLKASIAECLVSEFITEAVSYEIQFDGIWLDYTSSWKGVRVLNSKSTNCRPIEDVSNLLNSKLLKSPSVFGITCSSRCISDRNLSQVQGCYLDISTMMFEAGYRFIPRKPVVYGKGMYFILFEIL